MSSPCLDGLGNLEVEVEAKNTERRDPAKRNKWGKLPLSVVVACQTQPSLGWSVALLQGPLWGPDSPEERRVMRC
jgi:hypothetical protein